MVISNWQPLCWSLVRIPMQPTRAVIHRYTQLQGRAGSLRAMMTLLRSPQETSQVSNSVSKLAARGANLNARIQKANAAYPGVARPKLEMTPFLMAAQTADVELMKTLADLGADPLLKYELNRTVLMLAGSRAGTGEEVLAAMQLALDLGIDIDAVDDNGETAMHAAAYKNRPETIKFLADKGAAIEVWNRENKHGSTPFAIAVGYRRPPKF